MTEITDIKRTLNDRVRVVAEHLLPAGKLLGREWCVGSIGGEPGESLKVCVTGDKRGVWSDFAAGGEGGDLIDLWSLVRRKDLAETLDEIRDWLGLEKPAFQGRRREWKRPAPINGVVPTSAVLAYLTGERMLSKDAVQRYRIVEAGRKMIFPFYLPDGSMPFAKFRMLDPGPNGKKQIQPTESGMEPVLFGWQAVDPNARTVTICEGEIDAPTLFDYGFPAMSVPFGGGKGEKQAWIENEYDRLTRFELIYIATDNDKEGDLAAEEIASRLGRHRCKRVTLPNKDANDCRKAGVSREEIAKCFARARFLDPEELSRPEDFGVEVYELFYPPPDRIEGYAMPIGALDKKLWFRPAEVTLWTGASGSGKSQLLTYGLIAAGQQGAKACVASFEMLPQQSLKRMIKQAGNVDRPTKQYFDAVLGWLNEWLLFYNIVGKSSVSRMLEIFEYARCRYGCDVFVVDSLMRLGIGSEDYQEQEKAVYEMVNWAVDKKVHLHLVAHARKGNAGSSVPQTEDIKGASEIGANAFNIIGIWRDREAEAAQRDADETEVMNGMPPVILNVAKQRNGDWEGKVGLWFNQKTYQYRSKADHPHGRRFVSEGQMAANNAEQEVSRYDTAN